MSALLIKLFIKNPNDVKDKYVRGAYGTLGSFVGIACNLLLSIIKISVGLISGSISIAADGLNNLSDIGSSLVTMIGFKLAGKPADIDHPFGHGRMEHMSAFIVAILIILVGFELFKSSLDTLVNGGSIPEYSPIAIIILIISILIKLWLFAFNRKLGKTIDSEALLATAQDSLNDTVATAVILVSVIVSMVVTLPFNLDAILGIALSVFIVYSGIMSAKETLDQILGGPPSTELVEEIEKMVLSFDEFVGIHDLIVHNYGPGRQFASVHVEVPYTSDIVKCHEQVDLCEKQVQEKLDICLVIHMDPIDTENQEVIDTRTKLSDAIRVIDDRLTLHDFRMTPFSDKQTNLIFDVVLPSDLKISEKDMLEKIRVIAKLINPTFECVITFDRDFIGN